MSERGAYVLGQDTYDGLMDLLAGAQRLPTTRRPQIPRRAAPQPTGMAWVKVTSATTQTATLTNGSLSVYPAVWSYLDTESGTWADNDAVWFYAANGETPTAGDRYNCRLAGNDSSGQPIFVAEMQGAGGGGGGGGGNFHLQHYTSTSITGSEIVSASVSTQGTYSVGTVINLIATGTYVDNYLILGHVCASLTMPSGSNGLITARLRLTGHYDSFYSPPVSVSKFVTGLAQTSGASMTVYGSACLSLFAVPLNGTATAILEVSASGNGGTFSVGVSGDRNGMDIYRVFSP